MSVDSLLDQLVDIAAITVEQADQARALDVHVAASAAGRLAACGLDGDAMLAAVAQVSGIAVAPAALLARARRVQVKGGDPTVLRRLLAFPAGADNARVLQVLVADPESATHLPHLGLPEYRVWLAPERVVRELIAALPEIGPEFVTGVDEQMRMLRALTHDVSDVHTGLELGGGPAAEQEQFVTQRDLRLTPGHMAGAGQAPEQVPLPRAPTPAPARSPTPTAARGPARAATPPTARAPMAPSAPPRAPTPAAAAQTGNADFQAVTGEPPPAITWLPPMREASTAPSPEASGDASGEVSDARRAVAPLAKPDLAAAGGSGRGLPLPLIIGGAVVLALSAVVVVLLLGRAGPASTEDVGAKEQAAFLADARAKAAAGEHAWALAACTSAIAAKPGSSLAADAALLCARERVALGERLEAAAELRKLIAALPATDARRAQAEELLRSIVGSSP